MLPGRRADNGSIFVVQGPAPAGSLMEGGIAVTPLGAIYISELATSFSPIDLFQNNEQGAWYDPSDLSTMFQDSAGTTPVTADGQPVGLILDKSGRGNHASQDTAAKRPLYKTSGGLHWLQFDGVNNSLATAAIDLTATDKAFFATGLRRSNDSPDAIAFEFGSGSHIGAFYLTAPEGASRYGTLAFSAVAYSQYFSAGTAPVTDVISTALNLASIDPAVRIAARINASDVNPIASGGALGSASNFSNSNFYIGSRTQTSLFFNGRIYPLIILGRLATTQEITDTEAWVAGKTGVTLP